MVNSIRSKLQREENIFVHQHVDTICTKEFPHTFNHLGRRVGPFIIGHPYRLEQFVARIFVEQGYLRFDEKGMVNSGAIQKINFQESTNPELKKIQEYVYVQGLEQLNILNKLDNGSNQSYRRDYRKLLSDLNDLIRVRLAKITRLANQTPDMKSKKLLTPEELVLYESISDAIQQWREHLGNPSFQQIK
jgi:hypothetical protein